MHITKDPGNGYRRQVQSVARKAGYKNRILLPAVTRLLLVILLIPAAFSLSAQSKYRNDFLYYWQTINDNFAYFDRQQCDWSKVKDIYGPAVDTIRDIDGFVGLLEKINHELHNGHVFLNTNTPRSNRMIPSGADMKVVRRNNQYVITDLREGFNAADCGLKPGMVVTAFNGQNIDLAVQGFLPQSVAARDDDMYTYAANMLLAGTHDKSRVLTVNNEGQLQGFRPDSLPNKTEAPSGALLEARILPGRLGYHKINNALGNSDLITAFDQALDSLLNTNGLVLDLRETPGGGNTTVARAIMGRFITREQAYQKHIYTAEEKETGIKRATLELVAPRGKTYRQPVVVLAGYWTGSMGEGIAIGFDAMKRAKIAGTKMAGLLGEIYTYRTPEYKIPFSFPCVKLQHVNGQAREDFIPAYALPAGTPAVKAAALCYRINAK